VRKIPLFGPGNEFDIQSFDMAHRFCQRIGRFGAKIVIFAVLRAVGR
jgi:hypothetical protein